VVVSGEEMSRYMGIDQWEADHVTLVLEDGVVTPGGPAPVFPPPAGDRRLRCRIARPDWLSTTSVSGWGTSTTCLPGLAGTGFTPRNEIMEFHDRRLVFLDGPGIVVELAQWVTAPSGVDVG